MKARNAFLTVNGQPSTVNFQKRLVHALAILSATGIPAATLADSLPVRDQNPLLAGFALPGAHAANIVAAEDSPWTVETTVSWANSAIVQTTSAESLTIDAETRELRVAIMRSLPRDWALRIELPWRETTGGSLDGFIDDWHDTFGLPDGARASLPQDRLRMFYERSGVTLLDTHSSASGVGDLQIEVGKQLLSSGPAHLAGWFGIKAPTGEADDFTGSGSVDVSGLISGEYRFGSRYALFGQLGGSWLGDGDRFEALQNDVVWSAIVGASAELWQVLTLVVQFDAHSAVYEDTSAEFLGDAGILTVGGTLRFDDSVALSLSVSEDIIVESSPDVVFNFGLTVTF